MYEIPLFPLNTVLFPGMPISLHIFEERYRDMINDCIENQEPFGVVLIREGNEALGPLADPHDVGCTAQITQVERLPDGRMNIMAVGMDRFQIVSLKYDRPYLVGEVEPTPIPEEESPLLSVAGQRLRPWVERYLGVLSQVADDMDFDPLRLPNDPLALAYLAAALVQIPADQKQSLLAHEEAAPLLTDIRAIYRREVALLDVMVSRGVGRMQGVFSLN